MTILNTTTTEAEARLIKTEGQPEDAGFKLFRGWPWLAGYSDTGTNSIIDLISALNLTTTYTAPQANGRVYAGKFVASENSAFDETRDGTAQRDCKIVQELTRVKAVTDVASLGTPSKNRDRATLNFLGFKEGEQYHIYHKYSNLDTDDAATAMTLSPAESGYTIVKREFITEKDKTGTLFIVFEDDNWLLSGNAVWGSDTDLATDTRGRVRVGYSNYDENRNLTGHGMGENYQLTGISKGQLDTNWVASQKSDTKSRVITSLRRSERANGEYAIQQNQRIAYEGTRGSDALVVGYKDSLGSQVPSISRVWFRRTDTAKTVLVTPTTGKARTNDTFNGILHIQNQTDVTDHGDGTFTVMQNLKNMGTGYSVATPYFTDSIAEVKVHTRSKDNKVKNVYYWKFVSVKTSESAASGFIQTTGGTIGADPKGIVPGSDHIVKKAPFYYVASCKVHQRTSAGDASPKIDDWQ